MIGEDQAAPRFVAEVSSNHHRDLGRCKAFIDAAAALGCWGVKFQLFRLDRLFAPEILARSAAHRARRDWELPTEFLAPLAERARARGVAFGCTPFDLEAVDELAPHVDFLKIASYELLWTDLLGACARTGLPVIASTGMATAEEVARAVEALRKAGANDAMVLHCVSGYPAPPEQCNLAAIESLRAACGCAVGWSDHSRSPAVVARAVHRWGARVVEFHLDLDQKGAEYGAGHCWLPAEIEPVIAACGVGASCDGDGVKAPTPAESAEREWRADPADGLRPRRHLRAGYAGGGATRRGSR